MKLEDFLRVYDLEKGCHYIKEASKRTGTILIIAAEILWATMGVFVRSLGAYGFDSFQISAFRLLVAAIARPADIAQKIAAAEQLPGLILLIIATGVVTALVPHLIYTIGLKAVEPSRAAILAATEPMVATLTGMIVYREGLNLLSGIGIACILLAIILLNSGKAKSEEF